MAKIYGFIYDKQGNLKEVSAPVKIKDGKLVKASKPRKTLTGKLPDSIGLSRF